MFKIDEMAKRKELINSLIVRNLKVRYKNSVLGFFWTLLNPAFMIMIYYVFIRLMRFNIDLSVLLCGIIPWQFLVMCVSDNVHTISGNSSLVKKTYFPRVILPFSTSTANFVNFILSFFVLVVFLVALKVPVTLNWLLVAGVIFMQYCFCMGLSLIVSALNVYFKDTEHIVGVALSVCFFITPIIYPLALIPPQYMKFYLINPMVSVILGYRYFLLGKTVDFVSMGMTKTEFLLSGGISVALCFLTLIFGCYVFNKLEPFFADEL